MKKDPGERFLEIDRLSRRHSYMWKNHITGETELRIYRDPIFDEEKRLLQEKISISNKRWLAKKRGVKVRDLPKEHGIDIIP